jgi:hypothetical protein
MVAYVCNPSYLGGRDQEDPVQVGPGKTVRHYLKNKQKGLVECLPSKREAQSSKSSERGWGKGKGRREKRGERQKKRERERGEG